MSKKELRRAAIKDAARQLFIDKNIDQTTFALIAARAGVGEATVYRHFENKSALALDIAIDYVSDFLEVLSKRLACHRGSHLDQFEMVMDYYIEIFSSKPDHFIFLVHFDEFIIHNVERPKGFNEYEALFVRGNTMICDLTQGKSADSSVREDIDLSMMTHTFNISFTSLCQKLLLRGNVIQVDNQFEPMAQLLLMKNVMMDSLRR